MCKTAPSTISAQRPLLQQLNLRQTESLRFRLPALDAMPSSPRASAAWLLRGPTDFFPNSDRAVND